MTEPIKFPFLIGIHDRHEVFSLEVIDEYDAPLLFDDLRSLAGAQEYIEEKLHYAESQSNTRDVHFWTKELTIKEKEIEVIQLRLRVLDLVKQIQENENPAVTNEN